MKRIVKYLSLILIICLCFNKSVFSYEIDDEHHENDIIRIRQEIYDVAASYRELFDGSTSTGVTTAYYGVCSNVTVDGKTYTLEEYVAGVVRAEVGAETDAPETLKAHAIAARSYLLYHTDCSSSVENSQGFQAFKEATKDSVYYKAAQETAGLIVTIDGDPISTEYTSYPNAIFTVEEPDSWTISFQRIRGKSDTEWTWVGPKKETVLSYSHYASSTGAPSTTHHFGMSSNVAVYLEKAEGFTYDKILKLFYGDNISLSRMSDGSYIGDLAFVDGGIGQIFYFNQQDYNDYYYSTDTSQIMFYRSNGLGASISSHGCGPTSLAIVVSSLLGEAHGPIETTEKVCQAGGCTEGGSYMGSLLTVAQQYGLNGFYVSDAQSLVNELAKGDRLVIALMGPGMFTSGGHFIVLTGVRSDGKISVADPWSRGYTDMKWFDANIFMEQRIADFLVIYK